MNTSEKLNWLSKDFIELLASLSPEMKGRWGVMNAHQMVEHMSYSLRQANGKENKKLLNQEEIELLKAKDEPSQFQRRPRESNSRFAIADKVGLYLSHARRSLDTEGSFFRNLYSG